MSMSRNVFLGYGNGFLGMEQQRERTTTWMVLTQVFSACYLAPYVNETNIVFCTFFRSSWAKERLRVHVRSLMVLLIGQVLVRIVQ